MSGARECEDRPSFFDTLTDHDPSDDEDEVLATLLELKAAVHQRGEALKEAKEKSDPPPSPPPAAPAAVAA